MSFILDALRKSESERRREAVPDITRIPLAPARLGVPRWIAAVIGALSVTVVALALAWWHSARTPDPEPAETARTSPPPASGSAPASTEPAPRPGASRGTPERVAAPAASRTREIVPLAELTARSTGTASGPGSASRSSSPAPQGSTSPSRGASAADSSDGSSGASSAADTEPVGALPRLADLRAEGVAVPELKLELHAYSGAPTSRFVFINGQRYGEGDTLSSGQQIVRIAPEGAVLSHSGRRFLLLPD